MLTFSQERRQICYQYSPIIGRLFLIFVLSARNVLCAASEYRKIVGEKRMTLNRKEEKNIFFPRKGNQILSHETAQVEINTLGVSLTNGHRKKPHLAGRTCHLFPAAQISLRVIFQLCVVAQLWLFFEKRTPIYSLAAPPLGSAKSIYYEVALRFRQEYAKVVQDISKKLWWERETHKCCNKQELNRQY